MASKETGDDDIFKGSDSDDVQYKPKILKTFKVGISKITSMASDRNYFTVVCNKKAGEITLCDKDGEVVQKRIHINYGKIEDIRATPDFDRFFIVHVSKQHNIKTGFMKSINDKYENIMSYKFHSNRSLYFDDYSFSQNIFITGVCYLRNKDVAMSCVSEKSYEMTASSRRFIAISSIYNLNYLNSPKIVIEYKHSANGASETGGQDRLFTYPKRIAESDIGDLWIVDRKSPCTGDVKVCYIHGKLKFIYKGGSFGAQFDPTDIASNETDVLVISDCSNHQIHLVRNDGVFIQFLMTEQHGLQYPTSICVNSLQHAWVGCQDGTIHIVEYYPEFE